MSNVFNSTTSMSSLADTPYFVLVMCDEPRVNRKFPLPEDFTMNITSNFETPFASSVLPKGMVGGVATVSGFSGMAQAMTAQVWQSSNGIDFNLPLNLVARKNPLTEVRDPIIDIVKLISPSSDSPVSFMKPPGPQANILQIIDDIKSAYESDAGIGSISTESFSSNLTGVSSVSLGGFINFYQTVIIEIGLEFKTLLSGPEFGYFPWYVTMNLSFRTFTIPVLSDIGKIFGVSGLSR